MTVTRRLVAQFTGYEGLHPKAIRIRHAKALKDFDRLWKSRSKPSAMEGQDGGRGIMTVTSTGPDWQTETRMLQFGMADIFDVYASRSLPRRVLDGCPAFGDMIMSGTFWRYIRTSWRFSLFFLWPFLLMLTLIMLLVLIATAPLLAGLPALNLVWSLPLAIGLIAILIRKPGDRFFLSYLLDDWAAAFHRIRGMDKMIIKRRHDNAAALIRELEQSDHDEVVIFAHSLGTVCAIEAIADVERQRPELLRKGPVSFVAAGSCLLMIALHPKASGLRDDVRLVLEQSPVLWAEFQTLTDIIHFYGSDPVDALHLPITQHPQIHKFRFKNVHSASRYKRSKANFFLMHLLFLAGAEKRNFYDWLMFLHGPFHLRELMTTYKEQAAPLDEEGRLNRSI